MTKKELVEIYRNIYGKENVYYNYIGNYELFPDILYSLEYDDDDYRNSVIISCNEDQTEFFLSDSGDSFAKFSEEQLFEVMPTIKNLAKKYNVQVLLHEFRMPLKQFDEQYLKEVASDFMCFVFSVWYFVLHLAPYGYAFLERGYYFDETIESQIEFKGQDFKKVVEICKNEYDNFFFDEQERMYYKLDNNEKKYLFHSYDGYLFAKLEEKEEIHTKNPIYRSKHTFDELVDFLEKTFKEKFNKDDKTLETIIYENGKPIKFHLKEENGKHYFTDLGATRKNYKHKVSDDKLCSLMEEFDIVNDEVRFYISLEYLTTSSYNLVKFNRLLTKFAITSKDLNEYDFSRIKRFKTQLCSFEDIKEAFVNFANLKAVDFENRCDFECKIKVLNNKTFKFSLIKGKEEHYLIFENYFKGKKLQLILQMLNCEKIVFDKEMNAFKIAVYENDTGEFLNKLCLMIQFISFYKNFTNLYKGIPIFKSDENALPCDYKVMYKKLNKKENIQKSFGYHIGESWFGNNENRTMTLFFFNMFVGNYKKVDSLSIQNYDGRLIIVSNFLKDEVVESNKVLRYVASLFAWEDVFVDLKNIKNKISALLQLTFIARMMGLID